MGSPAWHSAADALLPCPLSQPTPNSLISLQAGVEAENRKWPV